MKFQCLSSFVAVVAAAFTSSSLVTAAPAQQAYLKASNTDSNDAFATSVAISGDTIVVGEPGSDSAYVFVRAGTTWSQQAVLKAFNNLYADDFGTAVAISGNTVVVGAVGESSTATGINDNPTNYSATSSGAAYVFVRTGATWTQQAYLKASNPGVEDNFGNAVAISADTLVVGAHDEQSSARGVNPVPGPSTGLPNGAAYVFTRSGTNWSQQAYLKASNTAGPDALDGGQFGISVGLSGDTAVVGAWAEDSGATGVNGDQYDHRGGNAGAAYVFVRHGTTWSQQAYLKPSSYGDGCGDLGWAVAVSGDTVVVGADEERSNATGVNGNQMDNTAESAGAAYVFAGLGVGPKLAIARDGGSGYFVGFNGITGFSYQLQRAPSVTGPWTTNATITDTVSGPLEFHDTNAPPGQSFYRVAQQ